MVGCSERTLRGWLTGVDGFREAVGTADRPGSATVADVLRGALAARTRDGRPDHAARLRAAALLLQNPEADAAPVEGSALPDGAVIVYPAGLELASEDCEGHERTSFRVDGQNFWVGAMGRALRREDVRIIAESYGGRPITDPLP